MARTTTNLAILFADIVGSTRLYESMGDALARELVSQCLDLMTEQITRFEGTVIKTIGDEIMCTFPDAEKAAESSMAMQEAIIEDLPDINVNTPSTMTIRIGLHFGSAILEGGDVYGDAVNVAARMAGLAKGGQIITTQHTADALPTFLRSSTRHLDRIPVKGKSDLIDIFEVIWQPEEVTRIATNVLKKETKSISLRLVYNDKVMRLDETSGTVTLGRGKKVDFIVDDAMASREHARIECRRDKFVLTDQSTNGTYVETEEGVVYLRREETTLTGAGKISFGRDLAQAQEVVCFTLDSSSTA